MGSSATPGARFEGRTMRAAVFRDVGRPLEIEEVEVAEPGPDEVLVRLAASGVCHSDLHVLNGDWPSVSTPLVLGHEGAGVVERVGDGVDSVGAGDPVVLSWLPGCGRCRYCRTGRPHLCRGAAKTVFENVMADGTPRLRIGEEGVRSFLTVGSLGEYTVVPESGAIPVDRGIALDRAAMVGCAVSTGVGAVINTARVSAGDGVAVIGCGGVGLSVVQGCVAQAADPLIAVDTGADKLELARKLGATHTVAAGDVDPLAAVAEITGGEGVDFAFEAIGSKATIEQAIELLAAGGAAVIVGIPAEGVAVELDPVALSGEERRVIGCNYGSCNPPVDFPRLLALSEHGRLDLDALISRRLPLEQVNEAFAAMERGEGVRNVIVHE